MPRRSQLLWGAYALFVVAVLYLSWHDRIFEFDGRLGVAKLGIWATWLGFLGYSIRCSFHEDLMETIGKVLELHWGRQIGADLYLGLGLALVVIYLNEGLVAALLWLVPTILFANLAILLYFAIHFDTLVTKLIG